MEAKEIQVGKLVTWEGDGVYKILGFIGKSKTKVMIQDIEPGDGWCPKTKKFIGINLYRNGKWFGWSRGENLTRGYKYEAHIKDLNEFKRIKPLPIDNHANAYRIDYGEK